MTAKGGLKAREMPASTRTVIVACKIPNGLVLQLQRPMERMEDSASGLKSRTYMVKHGKQVVVRGPHRPVGTEPKGFDKWRPPVQIEGGYALTHGVEVEFWNTWLEQNKEADYVLGEMIAAYATVEDATAACRERAELLSGLEPISTEEDAQGRLTDRRLPRPIGSMSAIGTEQR